MNGISFRHGSLFSGIGGFDYASSLMGWVNVFHCELNPFCRQVLKYHYPNSVSYEDITKTDFSVYRGRIDIITGGFPCQPYSLAGKRLGKDDERHLWPQMLRVIREVSPKWIVGENVFGIVNWSGGLVFEEVQADLEREGYEVQSYILPAAGVDAPHKRDRVWFVAYRTKHPSENPNEDGRRGNEWESKSCIGQQRNIGSGDNERLSSDNAEAGITTNTTHYHDNEQGGKAVSGGEIVCGWETAVRPESSRHGDNRDAANTNFFGHSSCGEGEEAKGIRCENNGEPENGEQQAKRDNGFLGLQFDASDTSHTRLQGSKEFRSVGECGKKPDQQFAGCFFSTWQNFPTQSPICFGNDGISSRLDTTAISFPKWRNESIKAAGNAVVPQVVLQIFKAIQAYEDSI